MSVQRRLKPALALAVAATLLLASCADSPAEQPGDDRISVVASTNVWADVARSIAGDGAEVTAIIDSPDQDPHEYEATARDQLALSRADVVIANGGGYDPFIDTLLAASESTPVVINAVEASGLLDGDHDHDHDHGEDTDAHADDEEAHEEEGHEGHGHIEGFNEHIWYHLHAVEAVAEEIAHELAEVDPEGAAGYEQRLADFLADLEDVIEQAHDARERLEGLQVAVTEPVPVWLLTELGLVNVSPDEFTEAVEEDNDVPPATLQEVLELVGSGSVAMLAYNSQTATAQTERVRAEAEAAGVPVVDFTETMPEGSSYTEWMRSNVERIVDAAGV